MEGCFSFLYDQINLTGAKEKNGIKIPLSLSWGAQLHCTVCFPRRSCRIVHYSEVGRGRAEMTHFKWHVHSKSVSDNWIVGLKHQCWEQTGWDHMNVVKHIFCLHVTSGKVLIQTRRGFTGSIFLTIKYAFSPLGPFQEKYCYQPHTHWVTLWHELQMLQNKHR